MPIILFFVLLTSSHSFAFDASFSVFKPDEKVQDRDGKENSDPYSPSISIGHSFNITEDIDFAPRFGYIKQQPNSGDSYGRYKIDTYYLLYDFIYHLNPEKSLAARFGIGTFLKQTSGDGGTVTIPNGNSTATAYRPSGTSKSYTGTLNLGLDYNIPQQSEMIKDVGFRLESHIFQPISEKRRYFAFQLGAYIGF